MTVRQLTPADYRVMPWRNGGGTTTELVVEPDGAGLASGRFLYRVSIADVATDGPFSRFEGYDRHIMLLAGAGMTLECGAHGTVDLRALFEPHAFAGEWDVQGRLAGGRVRDFNLMVDRARASASLAVRLLEAPETVPCAPGEICILHVIEGELVGAKQGDTLVARGPFALTPLVAARPRVAIARVVPRPAS